MSSLWLTWNVRGLGGSTKREAVKKIVLLWKTELLLLQETKLNEQLRRIIESWTPGSHMRHVRYILLDRQGDLCVYGGKIL